uniref:Trehalose-6-phosphate synthase 1 n=1 Tax=Aleuroglyphus ovatus TaxID=212130 RepID=A0A3Q8SF16_ALEOV|nr:trehalose-6-phosphate synthase 1 [Aleuroglyphus ovatus]
MTRRIIVSGTLPIHCKSGTTGTFAPAHSSVAASILHGAEEKDRKNTVFMGVPVPIYMNKFSEVQDSGFVFHPVHAPIHPRSLVFSKHISKTCHATLGLSAIYPDDLDEPYKEYVRFNQIFCREVQKVYEPGDTVVVMGKHLLLLPALLRAEVPGVEIVMLFLAPFPSHEIFSCVPHNESVLVSMLSSDRLELCAEEYVRNFIDAAFFLLNAQHKIISEEALSRLRKERSKKQDTEKEKQPGSKTESKKRQAFAMALLPADDGIGLDPLAGGVSQYGRKRMIGNEPDLSFLDPSPPDVVARAEVLEEYLQETMLESEALTKKKGKKQLHVLYAKNLRCLVCCATPSTPREFIEGIKETEEYKETFSRMQKQKDARKIVLLIESTRELAAPILNMQAVSFYLESKKTEVDFVRCIVYGESSGTSGSELSGLAEQIAMRHPERLYTVMFPNAYTYYALLSLADACLACAPSDALSLVLNEYVECNPFGIPIVPFSSGIEFPDVVYTLNCPYFIAERMYQALETPKTERRNREVICSTREWLNDLKSIPQPQKKLALPETGDSSARLEQSSAQSENAAGNCTVLNKETSDKLKQAYNAAASRMVILDYDGTLTEIVPNPADAKPTPEILELLRKLSDSPKTKVLIVTGRGKELAEEWFGSLNVEIYAEHGAYHRENGKWSAVPCDVSWIPDAVKVITEYVGYTPGSHLEVKNTCVVFHCGEHGKWCASALQKIIGGRARVVSGRNIIEVRPLNVDKGVSVLREYSEDAFTICAGDDLTDEDMFMVLQEYDNVHSICVGDRATFASLRISSPSELRTLLSELE